MAYTYWLPDETGQRKDYSTEDNSVIIIGANGSGKSKLGAWIEQQNLERVHRVGAQRNLNFSENIHLKSYAEAKNLFCYGSTDSNYGLRTNKADRWGYGKNYTTALLNDFEDVLAALIALKNNELDSFHLHYKESIANNQSPPKPLSTSIDKLIDIWNSVLPERKIAFKDSKFWAISDSCESAVEYSSTQMSDGERSVLYLAAQVLCVPKDRILIIDEPEIHLHRSIMNRLWKTLESYRRDCLFVYITHDTQFAAMHGSVDKIWVKEYDGKKWKLEVLEKDEDIPEELVMDILGSRKNVLFVEGEKGSYDYQLYSLLYPDYLVIPCGSCSQVITRTKAFKANSNLHNYQVYGLIDRDYRSTHEIETYKKDNIYTLDVAEVDNLFLVEGLVRFMANRIGEDANKTFEKVKDFVVNTKFKNVLNQQILQSVISEVKCQLNQIDISGKTEEEVRNKIDDLTIDFDAIKRDKTKAFQDTLENDNYNEILRIFNQKDLSKNVGALIGYDKQNYQHAVINLLKKDCTKEIADILIPYLPPEIAR